MESRIKIKATVSEMREFFEKDSGVRYYEIKDKRYTQAELDAMSNEKYNSEVFTFSVIYRYMELEKPLTGAFQKSPSSAMKNYIVSQDRKTGLWYAHMRGYQHVPVSGSFSEKRRDAAEYAKMYNGLPHKVDEIERKRREAFEKEMEKA